MSHPSFRRACVAVTSAALLSLGLQAPASAGIIGTSEAIAAQQRGELSDALRSALARDDLRARLAALGVDPAAVETRLAALTEAEQAELAATLDSAPAGGNVLAVVGIVFLVLLLLEYTGTIDIFKKVP